MSAVNDQLRLAFQQRKSGDYAGALSVYEGLENTHADQFSEWDAWSFAYCYRALKQYEKCLDTCRRFYARFPGHELLRQLYAWAIYYTQIARENNMPPYATLKKALDGIWQLSPPGTPYGCAERAMFKVIKHLSVIMPPDWEEIDRLLNKMEPGKLSAETYTLDGPGGRKNELASDREEWYSWKSKALLQTGQWQACVALCTAAESAIGKWHYSNHIWFARRKAAALSRLGIMDEAKAILEKLVLQKKDWFLVQDLAELESDPHKALLLCTEAALMPGDTEKMIRLFFTMAGLYNACAEPEAARQSALLCLSIRHHHDWPVPSDLEDFLLKSGGYSNTIEPPDYYLKPLQLRWKKEMEQHQPACTGSIYRLLPNGQSGFIKPDGKGGGELYFSTRDWQGKPPKIHTGMRVGYRKTLAWDKAKNRESEKAIHLHLLT